MIVVSDASAVHYLVLIDAQDVLPAMYGRVIVPSEVFHELEHPHTPAKIRNWLHSTPAWFEIQSSQPHPMPDHLHVGEAAAIALAAQLHADLLLMDDAEARRYAEDQGLVVIGTLGIIRDAARSNLLDIRTAISQLRKTNFRATDELFQRVVAEATGQTGKDT